MQGIHCGWQWCLWWRFLTITYSVHNVQCMYLVRGLRDKWDTEDERDTVSLTTVSYNNGQCTDLWCFVYPDVESHFQVNCIMQLKNEFDYGTINNMNIPDDVTKMIGDDLGQQLMIYIICLPYKLKPMSHAVTQVRQSMECPVPIKAYLRLEKASSTPAWWVICCWGSLLSAVSLGTHPSGVACHLSANVRNCNNNNSSLIYFTSFLTWTMELW